MKSYPERIAEMLITAPPVPPLKRKHKEGAAQISDDTKAKLILLHAAYATFDHPPQRSIHVF